MGHEGPLKVHRTDLVGKLGAAASAGYALLSMPYTCW
jgi:hypothetical protein